MDNFYKIENIGDDGRIDVFLSYNGETYRDYFYADDVTDKDAITSEVLERYNAFKAEVDARPEVPPDVTGLIDKEITLK